MVDSIYVETADAASVMPEVIEFYKSCGRSASIDPKDILVLARIDSAIVGVVRLCKEEAAYVLRTMQVRDDLQGKGLGALILNHFDKLLVDLKINRVYCMPYLHLEYFYSLIGFRKIAEKDAPIFLQNRAKNFRQRNPDKEVILMRK